MEVFDILATKREESGKGVARSLRRQGLIPAVLYGPKTEPTALSIRPRDLDDVYRKVGERVVFNLKIKNGSSGDRVALIKAVQKNHCTDEYLHVDFYEISLEEEVKVLVPVEFTGKAKGADFGGFFQPVVRELEVAALPKDLPDKVKLDISHLDVGQSLHVADVDLGGKGKVVFSNNFTIATVLAPAGEEKATSEKGEEGAGGAAAAA